MSWPTHRTFFETQWGTGNSKLAPFWLSNTSLGLLFFLTEDEPLEVGTLRVP